MVAENETWHSGIEIGDAVDCRVVEHAPFGVFVSVGNKVDGIIERIQMERDGYATPGDYPAVGQIVRGRVLGFRHYCHQIEVALPQKTGTKRLVRDDRK